MKKWLTLLVVCGSNAVQEFLQNNPGVNPVGLVISPKPVTRQIGQTQQFIATANFDDGSSADVTNQVQWSSSNPAAVTIGANTGMSTAVQPGQVTITASRTADNTSPCRRA